MFLSIKQNSTKVIAGAEPILYIGGKKGIVLLHGFLGSPYEMKFIAQKFIEHNFSVYVPRLPGHGTSLEDMASFSRKDWISEARNAYLKMAEMCDEVSIAGLSMGGILTILLAAEFQPHKIALISTPKRIPDRRAIFAPFVRPFIKIIKISDEEKGLASEEARKKHICYSDGIPVMAVWHLMLLINKAMRMLSSVKSQTLIIQSKYDKVIPSDSYHFIAQRIGTHNKEIYLAEEGNHTLTVDYGKEKIAEILIKFFS